MIELITVAALGLGMLAAQESRPEPTIRLGNEHFEYVLGGDGKGQGFIDKRTGIDYGARGAGSAIARVRQAGKEHAAASATFTNGILRLTFANTDVVAEIGVESSPACLLFEVKALSGEGVEEFTFVDIPLATKGAPEEPFAASALALNLRTKVLGLPGPSARLRASCYPRFGFTGARVAIIGCHQMDLRPLMKEVVRGAPELPHSSMGGPWAMDAPDNYGSYLMTSGITEDDVDDWIRVARTLGIRQIDFHGGRCFRFGDCEPDPKMYPKGRASLKAVIDKLHGAGILAGLHTYAFFMAKTCPWVTPVPDPRLGKDATFTLANAIAPDGTTVPVDETTTEMSTVTGFFVRNSVTLQIDDELITYGDISKDPPFAFKTCKRGAWGTKAAPHAKGAKVSHLRECFGLFVPDGDSTLLTDVAAKTAEIYNDCGFDMIYLDALDGEDAIAGRDNGWHYGSRFTFEICRRLKRPAIMEMSTFHHHLWFVRSRMGAWDHPSRSHKKFVDIHCEANEGCRRMFMPANLGWWSFKTWEGALTEPTFPDDIEYWCGKALANDSSIEIGITPKALEESPALKRLAQIVNTYEGLRLSRYFDESVKERLRVPGDEFSLGQDGEGKWRFHRVQYAKHKVEGLDGWSDRWSVTNRFQRQPLRLRIEGLLSAGPYEAPGNVTMADFQDCAGFTNRAAEAGIRMSIEPCADVVKVGKVSGRIAATSDRPTPQRSWAKVGQFFAPALNLSKHQAMGVWVHGDGTGAVLNLQLKSPPGFTPGDGDHYIILDFSGWRYFELIEPEGERHANYSWPYGGIYSIYRENVTYSHVHALNLFLNNIPAKGSVTCAMSPVVALPTVGAKLGNPAITVGGKTIKFPVEIESGSYLEFHSLSDCKVYGPKGEVIRDVRPEGDVPDLDAGANAIKFSCDASGGARPRARVTVLSRGE